MLAVVLSRIDMREFDQMVSLYTREQGKVELLAKGIKKITSKNSSNLEVFSVVDIEVAPGKEINHLTKVQPLKIFQHIFSDFDKIYVAGYGIRIAKENILVGEKDERVFDFLVSFLEFLDTATSVNSLNLASAFILKLWHYLGFSPEKSEHSIWLEGDWQSINNKNIPVAEQHAIHNKVINFAQHHVGKQLAKFVEHGRMN